MRPFHILLSALLLVIATGAYAQVNLTTINSTYHQNFDSLHSNGTTNDVTALPYGWTFVETGSNANTTYAASTGSANAGNTYSFGLNAERSLGGLQSGTLVPIIGASFINQTGSTITSIELTYRGEQWRVGTTGRTDRIDFQLSLTATALNNGTWSDVDALDFQSPNTTAAVGALNGNDTLNNEVLHAIIGGLNIEPGSVFFIRWTDFNASGADDGLSIDDFELTPIGLAPDTPAITFIPATLNFGEVNVSASDTKQYNVIGANLTDSIQVHTYSSRYKISLDGVTFDNDVTLAATGGTVFVRFAPVSNGVHNDSIIHNSGDTHKTFHVSGSGFDQTANIISIAVARTKPVGERVTIAGRITVGNEFANPAYLQDVSGGIPVFHFPLADEVSLGDSVIVTGPIGVFNDQKQISGSGIIYTILGPAPLVTPKEISLNQLAAHEGQLVTIRNISLVNNDFVFYPQSTEQITNGTIQADLRIDGDTGIPGLSKPQGTFDVTGVVGRFRTNAQLMPRFQEDIPGASVPANPSDSIPKTMTLDVVNWNLEFFGARSEDYGNEEFGPVDEFLQLQNVRRVIDSLKADIIAVQEVSDDSTFFAMVSTLTHYKGVCSDRYSYSFQGPDDDFPPQKVCFIYDTMTVHDVNVRVLFEGLYDSARTIDPSLLPGYPGGNPSSFYSSGRLPYLFNATVTIDGVSSEIFLVNVHAKSGATAEDRNRRVYDAQVLKDTLDTHFAGRKFIFLGDLNDDLDQSITTGQPSPYADFVNDSERYTAVTKSLSDAGARSTVSFNDVIDHQILSRALKEDYLEGSVMIATPFRLVANYANTTSDHLPVITRYKLKAPQINFVQGDVTISEDVNHADIQLLLDRPVPNDIQITLSVSGTATNPNDFTTTPAANGGVVILNIPAGDSTVSFRVHIINDILDELDEQIIFNIIAAPGLSVGDNAESRVTIIDNDIPTIAFEKILLIASEGDGQQQLNLKLSTPLASQQSISIQVLNGPGISYPSDYTSTPAIVGNKIHLVIPAGASQAELLLDPKTDNKRELPEIVTFYISDATSGIKIGTVRLSVFTILDSRRTPLQFSFYPNPTSVYSKLVCPELGDNERITAELRGQQGEIIFRGSGTLQEINDRLPSKIQSCRNGLYVLTIVHDEQSYTVRLSKQ